MQESTPPFQLDARLQGDCLLIGQFPLCQILLLNDKHFPWIILVPRRPNVTELIQLCAVDQQQLLLESTIISRLLLDCFPTEKLNTAAIGNIVSQLHIHHVARRRDDHCWPGVVWGYGEGQPYNDAEKKALTKKIQKALEGECGFTSLQSTTGVTTKL
ncbi:MAG: HIT family protein [Gammaproteobacteria bacterium]|nr:HIT family protein [Gammaproteobacteria bacterium]